MKRQKFNSNKNGVEVSIDNARFVKQFDKAQYMLDEQIKIDTDPWVPFDDGFLAASVNQLPSGIGEIEYVGPYPQYLYYGKLMIGPAPKQLTDIDLKFSTAGHPNAGPFWFEESKAVNKLSWLKTARKAAGGG